MEIATLQGRLEEIDQQSTSILARASTETRDLTVEETAEIDDLIAEFKATEANIGRMQAIGEMSVMLKGSAGRKVTPEAPRGTPSGDDDDDEDSPLMAGQRDPHTR